ncbi:hypothetical protein [Bacteroides sp.]
MKVLRLFVLFLFALFVKSFYTQNSKNELDSLIRANLEVCIDGSKNMNLVKDEVYVRTDNYPPYYTFNDTISGISIKYFSLINYKNIGKY